VLATAVIKVKDSSGEFHHARALLDSGSQVNLVTEDLAQKLRIKRKESYLPLTTVNETSSAVKHSIHFTCQSRVTDFKFCSEFWVVRSVSSYQPDRNLPYQQWNIPANLELADPYFFKAQKVDLLIGAEEFFNLICVGQIKISPNLPVMQKTVLGWIVTGKIKNSASSIFNVMIPSMIADERVVDTYVRKFWELEDLTPSIKTKQFTLEQQQCEDHFVANVKRLESGRLQVNLPFKGDPCSLGSSYEYAKKRFLALERRVEKDDVLKNLYMDFMREYRDLGHMSLAENVNLSEPHFFIPHQCVLRPESTTTKLRVVFDASSKSSTNV